MRSARVLFASLLAASCAASPAMAADISVAGGVLKLDGGTDYVEADIIQEGADFTVYDYTTELTPGTGCTYNSPALPMIGPLDEDYTMTCEGVTSGVEVTLGGGEENFVFILSSLPKRLTGGTGSDYLIGEGPGPTTASGGDGSDYVSGGSGADVLDGGNGGDALRGHGGTDKLTGGAGNDSLRGDSIACCFEDEEEPEPLPTFADVLDGGAGNDSFDTPDASDTLTGGDGQDVYVTETNSPVTVKLGAGGFDLEDARIFGGDATVTGDAGPNEIITEQGKDTVDPGAGADKVETGGGDDFVTVRDGAVDSVKCGEGADKVVADPGDEIDSSCDAVDRGAGFPAAPGSAPVVVAPALIAPSDLKVSVKRKGRRITLKGRLVLPAGAAPALCAGGGVTLEIRGVGRRKLTRGAVLDGKCAFAVKFSGKAKKRLRIKARFAGTPGLAPFASSR